MQNYSCPSSVVTEMYSYFIGESFGSSEIVHESMNCGFGEWISFVHPFVFGTGHSMSNAIAWISGDAPNRLIAVYVLRSFRRNTTDVSACILYQKLYFILLRVGCFMKSKRESAKNVISENRRRHMFWHWFWRSHIFRINRVWILFLLSAGPLTTTFIIRNRHKNTHAHSLTNVNKNWSRISALLRASAMIFNKTKFSEKSGLWREREISNKPSFIAFLFTGDTRRSERKNIIRFNLYFRVEIYWISFHILFHLFVVFASSPRRFFFSSLARSEWWRFQLLKMLKMK